MAVVGTTSSGKTTLAREIVRRLALPHVELDSLLHFVRLRSPRAAEAWLSRLGAWPSETYV